MPLDDQSPAPDTTPLPKGIHRRGPAFVVDVSYKNKRRTASVDTLEAAIQLRSRMRAELRGELPPPPPETDKPSWTIRKAIEVTDKAAWNGSTWGRHAIRMVRDFERHVGAARTLDTIDACTLDDWIASLGGRGKVNSTINRYLAAVSKIFTVAQERGGVVIKPKFPRKREANGRVRYLSDDEERSMLALFQQWGKYAVRDMFILLIDTGMRLGELERIEARDVDLKRGLIAIWRTKNDLPRSVPMTKRVRAVVERAIEDRPTGPLVRTARTTFRQILDRAKSHLELAQDRQLVPHALRHTCASRLVQRGVPLKVVQEWMGHKTITVTMRYAHLSPTSLLEAVTALEAHYVSHDHDQ